MIVSWTKTDGSRFMAKLDDAMEQTLVNFMNVNRAVPLTKDELMAQDAIPKESKIPESTVQSSTVKKKWWKR